MVRVLVPVFCDALGCHERQMGQTLDDALVTARRAGWTVMSKTAYCPAHNEGRTNGADVRSG